MNNILNFKFVSLTLIAFLMISMLGFGLIVHKLAGISALIILLISLIGLWVTRKDDYPSLCQWEKWWISSIFVYFGLIVLDVLTGYGGSRDLDVPGRLILAIPVFLYIRRIGFNINIIWMASALGSITSGIYAGYQYEILGMARAEGFTSPIYFGQIALIMAMFSSIGLILNKRPLISVLIFIAILMGLYAALVSGSRGGWVALITIVIFLFSISKQISLKKRLGFLIVLMGVFYSIYQSPYTPVKSRVDLAVDSVISYYQEDNVKTSSGTRLELWKAAWLMTKESNFLGVGESQYNNHLSKLIQKGRIKKDVGEARSIPHNQYLNTLSEQGLIGLISLLTMMFIPLKISLNSIRENTKNKLIALFPAILIISYIDFMLTLATLERSLMVTIYAFLVSILMGILTHSERKAFK